MKTGVKLSASWPDKPLHIHCVVRLYPFLTSITDLFYIAAYKEAEQYSDDDNSLSSYMSGATESLVSELSVDPLSSGSAAGQWTKELGNVLRNDGSNDDGNNVDDNYDDDDNDDEGVHGAEAAIWNFGEGPWQGLPDHGTNKATKLSLLIYHAFSVMLLQQDLFSLFGMYFSVTPLCVCVYGRGRGLIQCYEIPRQV